MQYDIKGWLLPSLLALAQRHDPISVGEGRCLGIETALKLASVREGLRQERLYALQPFRPYNGGGEGSKLVVGDRDPTAARLHFTHVIQKVFEL